jgi:hypothetical protein
MTTATLCPRCQNPVPSDAPHGLCPVCLLGLGNLLPEGGEPNQARVEAVLARRLPQYKLVKFAGRGGMGEVWIIEHTALGRMAALKLLSPSVVAVPGFAERFLREAKAMADLKHPHVVALYDFGECDGEYFLVMEYGESNLRTNIRRNFRFSYVLELFLPLCDAVEYVHDRGMVHRDLKPENVLWIENKLKLADFGLVGRNASSAYIPWDAGGPASAGGTGAGQVMGTPDYMAPEQWKNQQKVDHRVDIYALGLILYEMVAGERPRGHYAPLSSGFNWFYYLTHVCNDRRLDDVVAKALAPDPADRYQSAKSLRADVKAIYDRPVHVARLSDVGWLLVGATVLILASLAVVGWGKSVACHALMWGMLCLGERTWYFPWALRVGLRVGCVGCVFLDLIGPLLGLPPLVEPFPLWDPAGRVLAIAEFFAIIVQSTVLVDAMGILHRWMFPKFYDESGDRTWARFLQLAAGLLPMLLVPGLAGVAVVGYWVEGLWPVARWLPFTFATLLVPVMWVTESRRPARPVQPIVETPPVG